MRTIINLFKSLFFTEITESTLTIGRAIKAKSIKFNQQNKQNDKRSIQIN